MANCGGGDGGLLLLTKKPCSSIHFHKIPPPFSSWRWRTPIVLHTSYISISRCSRWDSNAEPIGSRRFKFKFQDNNRKEEGEEEEKEEVSSRRKRKKRRWWSDKPPYMEEEEPGILEEALDSFWIFKVLGSYGWMLPPIIVSLLLATGPKAFLMAIALPLGQSAITFVLKKMFGGKQRKASRKTRKRRKPFASMSTDAKMDNEVSDKTVKGKVGFESWVVNENGSINPDNQEEPDFGGWADLDKMGSVKQPPRMAGESRRTRLANDKLSDIGRRSDTPLLLRLLIAIFPFLGAWTKMFW